MKTLNQLLCAAIGHNFLVLLADIQRSSTRAHCHSLAGCHAVCLRCDYVWDDLSQAGFSAGEPWPVLPPRLPQARMLKPKARKPRAKLLPPPQVGGPTTGGERSSALAVVLSSSLLTAPHLAAPHQLAPEPRERSGRGIGAASSFRALLDAHSETRIRGLLGCTDVQDIPRKEHK